jgi:hypothetical protein
MKTLIFAIVMIFSLATVAAAQNLGGRYEVAGKNFDGSRYSGEVEIIVTSKNTCRINWYIGRNVWRGICMRNGSAFSAAYKLGPNIGLVIYEIKDDGSMVGLWTLADKSGIGREVLVPIR